MLRTIGAVGLATMLVAGSSAVASATPIYSVSIDTSSLVGTGSYSLDIQLIGGDPGLASAALFSAFSFDSGSPVGAPVLSGDASGDLSTTVALSDAGGFFNGFLQDLVPGSTVTFTLDLTMTGSASGIFPDTLSIALLDSLGVAVPTTGFFDELIAIDFGAPPVVFASGSDPARTSLVIPPPIVRNLSVPVPEPTVMVLVALGAAHLIQRRHLEARRRSDR
jgi:hypothetical protein